MTRSIACVLMLALPAAVRAQSIPSTALRAGEAPAPPAHHFQFGAGVVWAGGTVLGDTDARLRSNATGSSPPAFALFNTVTEVKTAAGFEGRVGFAITPNWSIEGSGSYATPQMVSTITRDTERTGTVLASEELEQFGVDVGVLWRAPAHFRGRLRPYLTGGAGYLRQLHQDRALVETGRRYYFGGGGEWWLRGGHGRGMTLALRAELRSAWRRGGIGVSGETLAFPEFTVMSVVGVP